MSESPANILEESVNLAIALLEGGNTQVQVSFIFIVVSSVIYININRQVFSVIYMDLKQHQKNSFKFFMINYLLHKKH